MDRSLGRDDGLFDVSYISGPSVYDATAPVDGATLRDVFRLYHAGGAWRARLTWQLYTPSSGGSPAKTGADWQKIAPFAATFSIMASLFLGPSAWQALNLHRFGLADFPLPAALDSIPSRLIFVMALVCGLVFIVAAIAKTWEVRAASRWPSARGRIVRSQEGFKLVQRNLREMPVSTRVAEIAYTFEAEGQPYQGTRFTLAERVPEADVPDVLARYPLHADVTVFYDAADPNVSTLDRATPAGLLLGSLKVLAVAVMAVAALMWLVTAAANVLTQSFPGIALPLIFLMGCGAFIMLGLFAVIQRRQLRHAPGPRPRVRSCAARCNLFHCSGSEKRMRTDLELRRAPAICQSSNMSIVSAVASTAARCSSIPKLPGQRAMRPASPHAIPSAKLWLYATIRTTLRGPVLNSTTAGSTSFWSSDR